jgi:hypothetical protein
MKRETEEVLARLFPQRSAIVKASGLGIVNKDGDPSAPLNVFGTPTEVAEVAAVLRCWLQAANLSLNLFALLIKTEGKVPPEAKALMVRNLNLALDMMQVYEPVVRALTRFCLKALILHEAIEDMFDRIREIDFARDFDATLAQLG